MPALFQKVSTLRSAISLIIFVQISQFYERIVHLTIITHFQVTHRPVWDGEVNL